MIGVVACNGHPIKVRLAVPVRDTGIVVDGARSLGLGIMARAAVDAAVLAMAFALGILVIAVLIVAAARRRFAVPAIITPVRGFTDVRLLIFLCWAF